MPARTNHFQKLVKTINQHLAPAGAKITESAMLYDSEAETDREIDILVESTILNCSLRIGIECTTERAPLDVRKIESFKEKHRKVGINQTIIVSKNGFSDSSKKYAQKNNIRLLTFKAAQKENWGKKFERLQGLSLYGRSYTLRSISAVIENNNATPGFSFDIDTVVSTTEGQIPLAKFAGDLFVSTEVSKKAFKDLIENENKGNDPWIEVGFDLHEQYEFTDSAGKTARPKTITIVMGYKSNYRSLETKRVEYDGQDMVVGGFFDKDGSAHIAIGEVDGKISGTLEVSENFLPPLVRNT